MKQDRAGAYFEWQHTLKHLFIALNKPLSIIMQERKNL